MDDFSVEFEKELCYKMKRPFQEPETVALD